MTFTEYPYNNLRKRFGALLSDQGFDLMNKCVLPCAPPLPTLALPPLLGSLGVPVCRAEMTPVHPSPHGLPQRIDQAVVR